MSTRTNAAQCPRLYNRGDKHNTPTANKCGFSPQLLLDDIINTSNNTVQDGVNGIEGFLQKCADERLAKTQSPLGRDPIMHGVELLFKLFWNTIRILILISLRPGVWGIYLWFHRTPTCCTSPSRRMGHHDHGGKMDRCLWMKLKFCWTANEVRSYPLFHILRV